MISSTKLIKISALIFPAYIVIRVIFALLDVPYFFHYVVEYLIFVLFCLWVLFWGGDIWIEGFIYNVFPVGDQALKILVVVVWIAVTISFVSKLYIYLQMRS